MVGARYQPARERSVVSESSIPLVDLGHFSDPGLRSACIDRLGEGLAELGFVAVIGHGIPAPLLDRAYATARQVFALPEAVKRAHETPWDGRQRGYTSFGVEHAKDTLSPDLKEFWHVGRDLGADHPLHRSHAIPPNRFPPEVPEFGVVYQDLFTRVERFANTLLEGVETWLGYPDGTFRELIRDGNSVLRVIHYPDVGDAPPGAVRAAAHEDINLLTVLPVSTRPGLELMTRSGEWMPVFTPPNVMVCDTGDMMALLTEGRLPATTHRVVNPPERDGGRLSMPFFLHPRPDAELRPGLRADDFLRDRLRAIGVA
jgi:isopenicillin N synthase-like dioxygenase